MRIGRRTAFWLLAFAGSYCVWLIHDDSAKLPELLAGVAAAGIAATGTELVRAQRVAPMALRLRFLRRGWRLIGTSVRDCVALTGLAFAQLVHPQPVRGRTIAQPFRNGGTGEAEDNARRALASGLGSFAPATIVVGVDPDSELVVAHQLGTSSDPDPLELG